MGRGTPVVDKQIGGSERLLVAMAEELKLPLLHIARQAELLRSAPSAELLEGIEIAAAQALWFVDSYLLNRQLLHQPELPLEPVTVPAVLQDAAHELSRLAKQYDCTLQLQLSGRYGPVMAHPQGLLGAMVGLGVTFIAAGQPAERRSVVTLAAHKSRGGVVAGVFSKAEGLSQALYAQGRSLYGRAQQPLQHMTAQPGAGVFIADSLLRLMEARVRMARYRSLHGLAATLSPSRQLALI